MLSGHSAIATSSGVSIRLREGRPVKIAEFVATGDAELHRIISSGAPTPSIAESPGGQHGHHALHQRETSHGYFWIILDNEA